MLEPLRYALLSGAGNRILIVRAGGPERAAAARDRCERMQPALAFDQLILHRHDGDRHRVEIFNRDGSPARQCGNGMRCLAAWLDAQGLITAPGLAVETPSGPVRLQRDERGGFRVALPEPAFGARAVSYQGEIVVPDAPGAVGSLAFGVARPERLGLSDREGVLRGPSGEVGFELVSVGNPHAILWLAADGEGPDAATRRLAATPIARLANALAPLFAEGVNLSLALRPAGGKPIAARVYERGAGETAACGSAACAIAAAARMRGWIGHRTEIAFSGGTLEVDWQGEGHPIWLGGPVEWIGEGVLSDE